MFTILLKYISYLILSLQWRLQADANFPKNLQQPSLQEREKDGLKTKPTRQWKQRRRSKQDVRKLFECGFGELSTGKL